MDDFWTFITNPDPVRCADLWSTRDVEPSTRGKRMRYQYAPMKVTIAIDPDHPSESWWRAARDAKRTPRELGPLLTGKAKTIEVVPERARAMRAWCATIAGWDPDEPPLSFVGLTGRPPSPRRGAGARRLTVWLAPNEFAVLEPLATTRGHSLADLLRTSALVEAQRQASGTTDADSETGEAVTVDAIEVGDLVYVDMRHLPRGHTERVLAVHREHDLWRFNLASGSPAWFGSGAKVWRKPRRRS